MPYTNPKTDIHSVFIHPNAYNEIKDCKTICDIGCDVGRLSSLFPNAQLLGIDINPMMKECLNNGYSKFHSCDLNLGIPEIFSKEVSNVDCFILIDILEHLINPLILMESIFKFSKKGALIYCCAPTRFKQQYWDDYTHIRPFTDMMMTRLLNDAGFQNLKLMKIYKPPFLGFDQITFFVNNKIKTKHLTKYKIFCSKSYSIFLSSK
jgi:SAM-dependent methyltransferase